MQITCDKCLETLDNAQLVRHLMEVHYTLPEKHARHEARRIRAEALRARQHAAKLIAACEAALDRLYAADDELVRQLRAVLAEVRGTEKEEL